MTAAFCAMSTASSIVRPSANFARRTPESVSLNQFIFYSTTMWIPRPGDTDNPFMLQATVMLYNNISMKTGKSQGRSICILDFRVFGTETHAENPKRSDFEKNIWNVG